MLIWRKHDDGTAVTNIIICGAAGRMGRAILDAAREDREIAVAGLCEVGALAGGTLDVAGTPMAVQHTLPQDRGAVVIEFTTPDATVAHLREAAGRGQPVVVGTTGLSPAQVAEVAQAARSVAVVHSTNYSVGVNLLWRLAREAVAVLGDDADAEIIEVHHNRKKDAPSGTALTLAEAVNAGRGKPAGRGTVFGRHGAPGERPAGEVGIHAVRGGDIAGDHTLLLALGGERLELTHRAHSREAFAKGALRAAKFAATAKPGLYTMAQVLGLEPAA